MNVGNFSSFQAWRREISLTVVSNLQGNILKKWPLYSVPTERLGRCGFLKKMEPTKNVHWRLVEPGSEKKMSDIS